MAATLENGLRAALALLGKGDVAGARRAAEKLVKEHETGGDAWTLLGLVEAAEGHVLTAADHHRKALTLDPGNAQVHNNLGQALWRAMDAPNAVAAFAQAVALDPAHRSAQSNLLLAMHDDPSVTAEQLALAHQGAGHRLEASARPYVHLPPTKKSTPLRVGYVGVETVFLAPVLAHHDAARVEVHVYASVTDETTQRMKALAPHWRDVTALSDAELARRIHEDGVDVLVDLSGHAPHNRLGTFALKPAPVQVSWLGYPDTTGLSRMDVRLTDVLVDPPGASEARCTERLVRVDAPFLCFGVPAVSSEIGIRLAGAPIRFGSFSDLTSISTHALTLWAAVLKAVPGSTLRLTADGLKDRALRERLLGRLGEMGVAPERMELPGHDRLDIALDTFPHHGTITTCQALWNGIPVVTRVGDRPASRVGLSILHAVGLPELGAQDDAAFVEAAVTLARDSNKLRGLSAGLRERMLRSPLMDARRLAGNLESAFEAAWETWRTQTAALPSDVAAVGLDLVRMADGCRVAVEATRPSITSFVLREQGDWFEEELPFVRGLLRPGDSVVDVGANHGVFALSMARVVGPQGHVYALEPAQDVGALLQLSAAQNGFPQLQHLSVGASNRNGTATFHISPNSEANALAPVAGVHTRTVQIPLRTMDSLAEEHGFKDVAFLKVDAEGEEERILEGGAAWLKRDQPLIMVEIKHGDAVNLALLNALSTLGYSTFRLLPGLNILVPMDPHGTLDPFWLNAFAATQQRAEKLQRAGHLTLDVGHAPAPPSGLDLGAVLACLPWTAPWRDSWRRGSPRPGAAIHTTALLHWHAAHQAGEPGARGAHLSHALNLEADLLATAGSLGRALTVVRLAFEMGLRKSGMEVLESAVEQAALAAQVDLDEPFLLPHQTQDGWDVGSQTGDFLLAAMLDARERMRAFSAYFTADSSLPELELLRRRGRLSEDLSVRRALVMARFQPRT